MDANTLTPRQQRLVGLFVSAFVGLFYSFLFSIIITISGRWGTLIPLDGVFMAWFVVYTSLIFLHGWRSKARDQNRENLPK